ncbi:MAG: hypothetical protein HOV94_01130, partial [Saccharothrix sp.]|nr:hypothetical protein [Saccharothrix sp.]
PARGVAAAHAGDVPVQRVELVDALDTMRNRPIHPEQEEGKTSIRRGAQDESLGLPPELLEQLERLVQQDQPVASTVDKDGPRRKPSDFGGGNAVNVIHEVGFDVKGRDAGNLRYIRFVKAAKISQGMNSSRVKRQRTVSGYVSWSSAVETPDMGKGADDDAAYQARLVKLLDEDFAAAKWSYDGPGKEFHREEKEGEEVVRLINVDTPGMKSDFMQYPIAQRYEFYGVLYDAAQRAILNVSHYTDRLIGLSQTAALTR